MPPFTRTAPECVQALVQDKRREAAVAMLKLPLGCGFAAGLVFLDLYPYPPPSLPNLPPPPYPRASLPDFPIAGLLRVGSCGL